MLEPLQPSSSERTPAMRLQAAKVLATQRLRQRRQRGEKPVAPRSCAAAAETPPNCNSNSQGQEEGIASFSPCGPKVVADAVTLQLSTAEQSAVEVVQQTSCKQAMQASLLSRYSNGPTAADSQRALTYGEADPVGFVGLLRHCVHSGWLNGSGQHGSFMDLGSGRGNLVLLAASTGLFARSHGIEYVPSLHQMALEQAQSVHSQCEVSFSCGDFAADETEWPADAALVFVALTVFGEALKQQLLVVLEQRVPAGALLVCVGGEVDSLLYEAVGQYSIGSSWGGDAVHIYRCVEITGDAHVSDV